MKTYGNGARGAAVKFVVLGVAVVGAAVAFGFIVIKGANPSNVSENTKVPAARYFVDVGNGKIFRQGTNATAPLAAPSGATLPDGSPGGLRAFVFACGSCDKGAEQKVRYVQMQTGGGSTGEDAESANPMIAAGGGSEEAATMVSAWPEDGDASKLNWVARDSAEGDTVISEAASGSCAEGQMVECKGTPNEF